MVVNFRFAAQPFHSSGRGPSGAADEFQQCWRRQNHEGGG